VKLEHVKHARHGDYSLATYRYAHLGPANVAALSCEHPSESEALVSFNAQLAGNRDEASAYFGKSAPNEPEILMVSEPRMSARSGFERETSLGGGGSQIASVRCDERARCMALKTLNGERYSIGELVQQGERLHIEFVNTANGDEPSEAEVRVSEDAPVRAFCFDRLTVCAKRPRLVAEYLETLSSEVMRCRRMHVRREFEDRASRERQCRLDRVGSPRGQQFARL
jgi:hypothetical protein